MNISEIDAVIERLKAVPEDCRLITDVTNAFMGNGDWRFCNFRDELISVLIQARSKWWFSYPSIEEEVANLSDGMLAEHGLMRLPKDRDGEIIRPGDMVDLSGEVLKVNSVKAFIATGSSYYHIIMGDHCEYSVNPDMLTHHREPNVEDILRDFAEVAFDVQEGDDLAALVEEYAEKLREVMDA